MASMNEVREKERRVRELLESRNLDAAALATVGNFAWVTCGGSNYVGVASDIGTAVAVITHNKKYVISDKIEYPRLAEEEKLAEQGFELVQCDWHADRKDELIREAAGGDRIGSDASPMKNAIDVSEAVDACRRSLTPEEIKRYAMLGRETAECVDQAARELALSMAEHEIAGILNGKLTARGIVPNVTLIAVDDRISRYRHPLPTDRKLKRYVMLVTGARKWGLIISMSRLVHFGPLSSELQAKHEAVTRVDAAFITGTVPGARTGGIFSRAVEEYRETGFGSEWRLHHQGGPTGYKGRDARITASSDAIVAENQAFAWNPSITGTKSEDTIIATPGGPLILSEIAGWPMVDVEIDGKMMRRPWILVR